MSSAAYYPLDANVRGQLTTEQFQQRRQQAEEHWQRTYLAAGKPVILVGWGSCSVAHGAVDTFRAIRDWLATNHVDAILRRTGCIGPDFAEPLVDILLPTGPRIAYHQITADRVPELLESVLRRNDVKPDWAFAVFDRDDFNNSTQGHQGIPAAKDLDHFKLQKRIVMRNMGYIDPESIDDYIARGGYRMLAQVLAGMKPEEIIKTITDSNLRGRGGAGFPAGIKWDGARKAKRTPKYVICNAHEGEPNVFKDRRLLESDPHAVLEGLIIQCYAIGTPWAYIYVGDEYPLAIHRTKEAVRTAYALGLLGDNILGSGFSCHVDVQMGGGAYISGEGTALMFGIEGKRAMPRAKVQRSVEAGLFGLPTCVNNVETMINVPYILQNGAAWYTAMGTESSKGTKLFTLMGNIERVGTVELEMGRTMRDLVYTCGGGTGARPFKAIQTGGPSGGCLAEQHLDLPMDFQSLEPAGGTMGSGGYVVYDDSVCIVDMSRYFNRFNRYQSCGKCFPCRMGTKSLLDMTDRIAFGGGRPDDLDIMWRWSEHVVEMSLCGLGTTAPLPLMGGIRWFRDEFVEHITDKYCRTRTCTRLNAIQARKQANQSVPDYEPKFLPPRIGTRAQTLGSASNRDFARTAGTNGEAGGARQLPAGRPVGRDGTIVVSPTK
ncbi:MAG TPA: NADH-ubiquinone oxidoreductase-F iron-sulfur binding region domain-containing protein [Chloroflexia bacterium]|nr:NADH-ubiquinone oxidoreductase-F iron-sulfur binding region domain-containing protein [Chloroflexia bacterium]